MQSRHSILCQRHGIRYNPTEAEGCVICQREGTSTRGSSTNLLLGIGIFLVVGFLLVWAFVPSDPTITVSEAVADLSSAADMPGVRDLIRRPRIDPQPVRAEIDSLEQVLYRQDPPGLATADEVSAAARKLSEALQKRRSPSASSAAIEVLFFSEEISGRADVGYSIPALTRSRKRWEEVRGSLFLEADWFRQSSAALDSAQTPKPPEADPEVVRSLRRLASDLEMLILKGKPEALQFGEPYVDVAEGSAELRRLGDRWNRWSRDWSEEVQRYGSRMPRQPPLEGPSALLSAYNSLGSALNQLNAVPHGANDSGIPFRPMRESRFQQAEHGIREAIASLNKLAP